MTQTSNLEIANDVSIVKDASGRRCAVTVDGKEQAIRLRQQLVRRGVACTFPVPTWTRGRYSFLATCPNNVPGDNLPSMVTEVANNFCA